LLHFISTDPEKELSLSIPGIGQLLLDPSIIFKKSWANTQLHNTEAQLCHENIKWILMGKLNFWFIPAIFVLNMQ